MGVSKRDGSAKAVSGGWKPRPPKDVDVVIWKWGSEDMVKVCVDKHPSHKHVDGCFQTMERFLQTRDHTGFTAEQLVGRGEIRFWGVRIVKGIQVKRWELIEVSEKGFKVIVQGKCSLCNGDDCGDNIVTNMKAHKLDENVALKLSEDKQKLQLVFGNMAADTSTVLRTVQNVANVDYSKEKLRSEAYRVAQKPIVYFGSFDSSLGKFVHKHEFISKAFTACGLVMMALALIKVVVLLAEKIFVTESAVQGESATPKDSKGEHFYDSAQHDNWYGVYRHKGLPNPVNVSVRGEKIVAQGSRELKETGKCMLDRVKRNLMRIQVGDQRLFSLRVAGSCFVAPYHLFHGPDGLVPDGTIIKVEYRYDHIDIPFQQKNLAYVESGIPDKPADVCVYDAGLFLRPLYKGESLLDYYIEHKDFVSN